MVVGSAVPRGGNTAIAWTFLDGTFDYLPTLRPEQQSVARDIAAGRIVGSLVSADDDRWRAVAWEGADASPIRLPLLPGWEESSAEAMNAGGAIYGWMLEDGGPRQFVKWKNGDVQAIDTPRDFRLADVAGRYVVGSALNKSRDRVPVVFSQGAWTLLESPGGFTHVTRSGYGFGWFAGAGSSEAFATYQGELTLLKDGVVAVSDAHGLTAVFTAPGGGFQVRMCYADTL